MKAVYLIKCIYTPLWKGVFFCVKRFWPITRVENKSQEKDFFVIQNETRFCYMEDGWKVRMNRCTALWSFVNFCYLSQSEVSTDNRKVSTFFAFQHVRSRCCYRSYLDRFLKDIQNTRQNRSKNKLDRKNAGTQAHGSCSLRVMGSG